MCYKNRAKYKFSQKSFNKMEIKEKSNIFGRSLIVYIVLMYLPLYPPYPCFIWIHDTGGRNSSFRGGAEGERGSGEWWGYLGRSKGVFRGEDT